MAASPEASSPRPAERPPPKPPRRRRSPSSPPPPRPHGRNGRRRRRPPARLERPRALHARRLRLRRIAPGPMAVSGDGRLAAVTAGIESPSSAPTTGRRSRPRAGSKLHAVGALAHGTLPGDPRRIGERAGRVRTPFVDLSTRHPSGFSSGFLFAPDEQSFYNLWSPTDLQPAALEKVDLGTRRVTTRPVPAGLSLVALSRGCPMLFDALKGTVYRSSRPVTRPPIPTDVRPGTTVVAADGTALMSVDPSPAKQRRCAACPARPWSEPSLRRAAQRPTSSPCRSAWAGRRRGARGRPARRRRLLRRAAVPAQPLRHGLGRPPRTAPARRHIGRPDQHTSPTAGKSGAGVRWAGSGAPPPWPSFFRHASPPRSAARRFITTPPPTPTPPARRADRHRSEPTAAWRSTVARGTRSLRTGKPGATLRPEMSRRGRRRRSVRTATEAPFRPRPRRRRARRRCCR